MVMSEASIAWAYWGELPPNAFIARHEAVKGK